MLHGQSLDPDCLALLEGLALELGPSLATLVGLAVGLSLSLLGAGSRGGGGLAPGRGYSHGRTPRKEKRRACREAVCGGAGGDQSQVNVASGNHAIPARGHRIGVTSD